MWDDRDFYDFSFPSSKKAMRVKRQGGGHVMGKPEAKMMRKIQAENNLTEDEVRSHKKFRRMLADAAHHPAGAEPRTLSAHMSPQERFISQVVAWTSDKEMAERLYKRFAGIEMLDSGLIKRPEKFHYTKIGKCHHRIVMETIDRCTDGMFVYNMKTQEVGFMYESNISMFVLTYEYKRTEK